MKCSSLLANGNESTEPLSYKTFLLFGDPVQIDVSEGREIAMEDFFHQTQIDIFVKLVLNPVIATP